MIYAELFFAFLKVGVFSFGGGYGAIALIRDTVLAHGWLDEELLSYMIGVSESTPGPIMVNLATYVGAEKAGFAGAACATAGVVIPPLLVVLLLTVLLKKALRHPFTKALMESLKPCVVGIILATGVWMTFKNTLLTADASAFGPEAKTLALTGILAAALFAPQYALKKRVPPIALILLAAGLGIAFYGAY